MPSTLESAQHYNFVDMFATSVFRMICHLEEKVIFVKLHRDNLHRHYFHLSWHPQIQCTFSYAD